MRRRSRLLVVPALAASFLLAAGAPASATGDPEWPKPHVDFQCDGESHHIVPGGTIDWTEYRVEVVAFSVDYSGGGDLWYLYKVTMDYWPPGTDDKAWFPPVVASRYVQCSPIQKIVGIPKVPGVQVPSDATWTFTAPELGVTANSVVSGETLAGRIPEYVAPIDAMTRAHDFTGDGNADLLGTVSSDATLSLYQGDGVSGFIAWSTVGNGWSPYSMLMAPGDFDGARRSDLIARKSDGTLWMWPGRSAGGFGSGVQIGNGWGAFTAIVAPGDFSGDGKPDLIARTSAGALYLYRGNGAGGFTSGYTVIGSRGWQNFTAIIAPGDFSGDGNPDLIARTATGQLYLYRGNGAGGFTSGYTVIGNGWANFTAIIAPGDFNGDGNVDLIARTSAGKLYLYSGNGHGGFLYPYPEIGHGWADFTSIV